jgi:hypothetical protein
MKCTDLSPGWFAVAALGMISLRLKLECPKHMQQIFGALAHD